MSLEDVYHEKVKEQNLQPDELQIEAIHSLQEISDQLETKKLSKINPFRKALYPQIKGLYMWGGVGRGKTFIMDIFYDSVPILKKKRLHFSHFMQEIHKLLREYQGKKNPIAKVAYHTAQNTQLICFDEFFVEDIADAVILGNIFKELFKIGVVLVATSNIEPKKLYLNGLQRELFLPAIDVLIEHVNILNLDSGIDYRFRLPNDYHNYIYPYNETNRKNFFDRFFTQNKVFDKDISISILGRNIPAMLVSDEGICFECKVICGESRSANDYIELCKIYKEIFVYNLIDFSESDEDMARRFISFIDECYDQGKRVIILAHSDFKDIYQGKYLNFQIQRTISRLNDMQNLSFGKEYE